MRMVFALTSNKEALRVIYSERPANLLCSQLWLSGTQGLDYGPEYFLLDSGAFTAWSVGKSVGLAEYAEVAIKTQQKFSQAKTQTWTVNLDVIPGEAGRTASKAEIEAGMTKSLHNADFLRAKGLRVIEVFHQNEPLSFLDLLLERRADEKTVVGISPRNDVSVAQRAAWLRGVLGHLVKTVGVDNLPRTHGFAATGLDMLRAFPFYSADSSSWLTAHRYGACVGEDGRMGHMKHSFGEGSSRVAPARDVAVRRSIQAMVRVEQQVTTLWQKRGVVWSD